MDRTDKIVASLLVTTIIGSVVYYFLVHKKKTEVLAIVPDTKVLIEQLPNKPIEFIDNRKERELALKQSLMLGSKVDLEQEMPSGRGMYVKK